MPRNKFNQEGERPVHWKLKDTDGRNRRGHNGKIFHAHGLEELILLKGPYYPKQSAGSVQSL